VTCAAIRCAAALAVGMAAPISASAADEAADAVVLAILRRHCVACHAAEPTHAAFARPPKGVTLESLADLAVRGDKVVEQVVELRNMPLGDEADMTEAERSTLARWIAGRK
jgi:uncharacterized membrane protein